MPDPAPALAAATAVLRAHGLEPDRCEVLQNGHTLVVRLTETLVARIVQATDETRRGSEWFERETALARHLTAHGAPVIPLHPDLPPGPHVHDGFPMNFWRHVTALDAPADPAQVGRTLARCHAILRTWPVELPPLAIFHESLGVLDRAVAAGHFAPAEAALLHRHLHAALDRLAPLPHQALHGDAHFGNLLVTSDGLLWGDWEDAFAGPVEWDLASIIWNARLLEGDHATADAILAAYRAAGGHFDDTALTHCLTARAAVMSAWYPVLYPHPDATRRDKLRARLDWLRTQP